MTAEQALEAAKGLTFEKVWAAMMESKARMEERDRQTDEIIAKIAKSNAESKAESAERVKQIEKSLAETAKMVAELSKNMGGFQNSVSRFIETMLSEDLCAKFSERGYEFTRLTYHTKYKENNKPLAEVDAILENGEYILLAEVKTKLSAANVNDHLKRIEIIRDYMDKRGDARKIIGAVAGGVVPADVLRHAQKNGLFVIVQSGESAAIADTPEEFAPREW
jgi:hypothetical protein